MRNKTPAIFASESEPEVNLEGNISKGIEKTNSSKSQRTLVGMLFSETIFTGLPIIEAVLVGAIHQALPAMFLAGGIYSVTVSSCPLISRMVFSECQKHLPVAFQEATNCLPDRRPSRDHAVRLSSSTHSCSRSACRFALLERASCSAPRTRPRPGLPSSQLSRWPPQARQVNRPSRVSPAILSCGFGVVRVLRRKHNNGTSRDQVLAQFGGENGANFLDGTILVGQRRNQNMSCGLKTLDFRPRDILGPQTTRLDTLLFQSLKVHGCAEQQFIPRRQELGCSGQHPECVEVHRRADRPDKQDRGRGHVRALRSGIQIVLFSNSVRQQIGSIPYLFS